jgi:hypothetical protein
MDWQSLAAVAIVTLTLAVFAVRLGCSRGNTGCGSRCGCSRKKRKPLE